MKILVRLQRCTGTSERWCMHMFERPFSNDTAHLYFMKINRDTMCLSCRTQVQKSSSWWWGGSGTHTLWRHWNTCQFELVILSHFRSREGEAWTLPLDPGLAAILTKVNNFYDFLFVHLLPKMRASQKDESRASGSEFFSLRGVLFEKLFYWPRKITRIFGHLNYIQY